MFGKEFLGEYIEKTNDYKKSSTTEDEKKDLKNKAFSCWVSYVYLKNSDSHKYGTLKKSLQSQYALQNNQYPKTIGKVTDVLTNHQWDDSYQTQEKKIKENRRNSSQNNINDDTGEKSLAQTSGHNSEVKAENVRCFCCGDKGHFQMTVVRQAQLPEKFGG